MLDRGELERELKGVPGRHRPGTPLYTTQYVRLQGSWIFGLSGGVPRVATVTTYSPRLPVPRERTTVPLASDQLPPPPPFVITSIQLLGRFVRTIAETRCPIGTVVGIETLHVGPTVVGVLIAAIEANGRDVVVMLGRDTVVVVVEVLVVDVLVVVVLVEVATWFSSAVILASRAAVRSSGLMASLFPPEPQPARDRPITARAANRTATFTGFLSGSSGPQDGLAGQFGHAGRVAHLAGQALAGRGVGPGTLCHVDASLGCRPGPGVFAHRRGVLLSYRPVSAGC